MENRNSCLGNTTREASQNYNFNFFWMGFKGWQGHCCCPEEIFPVPLVSLYLLWILKWFFFKTICYFVLVSRSMALKESFTYYTKAALSIPQMITSTPYALLIQLSRVRSTLNLLQYWVAQGYGLSWSKETICWVWGKVMLHFVQMASLVRLR